MNDYNKIIDARFLNNFKDVRAGFSLRKINKDNELVIRARRLTDNAEDDFTWKEINNGTLTTWVGVGNNATAVKFYGQKNSYDGTQSTATKQPLIVESGNLILQNGKPSLKFDGTDDTFSIGVGTAPAKLDIFFVAKMNAFTENGRVIGFGTSSTSNLSTTINPITLQGEFSVFYRTTGNAFRYKWDVNENEYAIFNLVTDFNDIDATCKLYENGVELLRQDATGGTPPSGTFVTPLNNFLNLAGPTVFNNINFQEVALFDEIKTDAQRQVIFKSLNQYYNVY